MAHCPRLNNSGLPLYHLSRFGPPASLPTVPDVMDLNRVTTIIGRNPQQVNYVLDSSNLVQRAYISRLHARIIREGSQHKLYDDSLNGVFINHIKITGFVILNEGDLVTFGHPNGKNVPGGTRKRQSESEYQFLFGRCDCGLSELTPATTQHSSTPTAIPEVQVPVRPLERRPDIGQATGGSPSQSPSQSAIKKGHIKSESATLPACQQAPATQPDKGCGSPQGVITAVDSEPKSEYPGSKRSRDSSGHFDDVVAVPSGGSIQNSPEAKPDESCSYGSKSVTKDGTNTEDALPVPIVCQTEDDEESDEGFTDEAPIVVIDISSDSEENDESMKEEDNSVCVKTEQKGCVEIHDSDTDAANKCLQSSSSCMSDCGDAQPLTKRLKIEPSDYESTDKTLSTNAQYFCANSTSPVFSTSARKRKVVSHGNTRLKRPKKQWTFSAPIEVASSSYKVVESSQESYPSSESEVTEHSLSLCSSPDPSLEASEGLLEPQRSFQHSEDDVDQSKKDMTPRGVPEPSLEASEGLLEPQGSIQHSQDTCYVEQSKKDMTPRGVPEPSLEASEGLLEPQGSIQHSQDTCDVEKSKKDMTSPGAPDPSLEASDGLLEPQGSIQHSEDDVEQSKKDMTPQGHPEPQSTSVAASKGLSVSPSYVPPVKLSEMPKDIPDMDQSVEVDTKETDVMPISEKPMIASVVDSEPMQSTSAESVETPADGGEHLVVQREESHKSQVSETQTGSSVLPVSSHADGESTVLPSTESLKPPRDDGDVSEEGESPTHDTVQEVVQQDDGSSQQSPSEPDCRDIQVTEINTLKDQADSESSVIGSDGITDSKYIFQESRSYDIGQADNETNQDHDTSSNGVGSEGNDKMSIQVTTEPVLNSLQQEQTLCASRDVSNPVPSDEVDSIGQSSLSCEGDISGSTTGGFGGHEQTGVDGRGVPDQKVSLPSVSSSPECLEKGGHVPEQPESSVVCEQDAVPSALCVPTNSVSNVVCDPTDSVPNMICDRTDASVCEQTDTGLSLMCERRNDFPRVGCVQSDDVSERTNCLCVDLKTAVHKEDESDVGMNACESRSVHGSGEHSVFEDSKENCARVVPVIKEIHTKGVLSQDNVETQCRNRGPDIVDSLDQITPITRQLSIPRENSPILVEDQLLSSVESQPIPKREVFLVAATEEIKERICLEKEELSKSTTVTDGQGRHSKDNVSPLTDVDTDVVINPSHITYTHPSQSGYSKSDVPSENSYLKAQIAVEGTGKEVKREALKVHSESSDSDDMVMSFSPCKVVTVESSGGEEVLKELPGKVVTIIESTEDAAVNHSSGTVVTTIDEDEDLAFIDCPENVVKKIESTQDDDLALNSPGKAVMTIESTQDEDVVLKELPGNKVTKIESTQGEDLAVIGLPGKVIIVDSTEDEEVVKDSPEKVITVDSTGDEEIVLKELPGKAVTIIESTEDGDAALNHSPGMEVTTMESTEDEDLAVQDRPERLVTKVDTANDLPSMNLPGKIVTTIELTEDSAVVMGSPGKMATAVVSTEDEDVVEDSSGKVITVESTEDLAVMHSPGKEVTTVDSNLQASRLQPSKCGIHLETTCDKNSDFEKDMCLLSDNMKEKPKEDLFHENMDAAVSQIEDVIAHQFDTEQQHSADEDRKHAKSSQEPHDADVQEVVTQGIRVRDNDNCALENIVAGWSTTVLEHNVEGTHMTDGMNTALEEKTGSQESGSLSAASVNHISDSAKGTGCEEVKDVAHAEMIQRSDGMEPSKSDGGHILKVDVDTIEDEDELSPVIPHQEPFTSPKKSEPKQEDSAPSELEFFPESQPDFHLYLSQAEESAAMMPDNSESHGDSDTSLTLYDEVTGEDPECQGDNEAEDTTIEGQGDRQTDVTTSENPQCQGDIQSDVTASKDPEGHGGNEANETTNEHPQGQADNEADVTTFDDTEGQADNEAEVTMSEGPEGQADNEAEVTMSEGPEGQADNEAEVTMSEGPEGQADNEAEVTMSEGPEGQADNEADVTMTEGPEGQADNEADMTMSEGPEVQADNEADVTMSEGPEGQADNEADVTVSEDPEGQADNDIKSDVTTFEDTEDPADNYVQTDKTTFGNPESQSNNKAPEGQDDKCATVIKPNVKVKNQSDDEVTSMLPNEPEVDTEGHGDYEAASVLSNETQVEDAIGHGGIEASFVLSNEPVAENPEGHGDNATTVIKPDMATVVGLEGRDDFGCCGRPRSDVFQTEQGEQTASEPSETRGENSAQETDVLSLKVTMNDETDRRTLKEEGPVSQNRSVSQQNEAFGCKSKMEVDNSTHSVAMNKGSLVTAGSSLLSHGDNHIPIIDKMFTVACSKCSFEKSPLFGTRRLQSESSDCMTCAKHISVPLGQAAKSDVDKTKLHDENKHGNCISKQIIQKDKDQEETFEFSLLGTDFSASTPKSSSVSDSLIVNCDGLSYQDISYSVEPGLSSTTDVEETSETEQDPEGSCQAGADVELQDGSECHAAASDGVLLTESKDLNKSSHISNRKEMMRSCRLSDETELHLQLSGIESQTSNVESCSGLTISQPELTPSPTGTHDADDVNETVAEGDNDVARPAASPHKLASEEETLISDEDLHLVMTTSDESQLHNDSALSAESTEVFFVSPVIKFKASKETESSKMLGTICEGEPLCSSSTEQRWIPSASELDSSQLNLLQEISQSSCNSDKGELTAESIALETITDDNSTCTQESMMSGIAPLELSVDAEESDEETEEASQGTSFHHEQKVETSLTSSLPSESHHETVSGNLTVGTHSEKTKDQPCGQGYGFAKYGDIGGAVKIVRKDISSRSDSGCDDHTTKEQPSTIGLYRSMSDSKPTFIAEPLFRVDDSNTIIFDAIEDIQRSERKPSLDEVQSFHEKSNMGEVSSSVDMVEQEQACPLSSSPSAVTDGLATEKRDNMSAMDLKSADNRTTLLQPQCSVSESQKSLSREVHHNSDEVPDLDYSPDPQEPGHEHDKVTSRLVDDHHATEISNKTNETDITLEVNEYGAISSRAVGSEKVKIDDGVVLTRMKMMNYVDSVPDSEDSLAIIDLRDDMPKEREQCSLSPTDSRQMSGLNKMTTSDKNWDELDGLSEEHLPNCNLDAQDSSPFPAPRLDDTNVEAGKMDASVDVSELVTDDVRGGGVAEGTSHLPHGSSPEEQCMPIIVECWSNAPHSRKRKASEDRAVKKRSCRASLSLKACLGSKVAEFFLIRERVKTFMPCNPISDKETMACQNSGQAQEQNSLRKGKQGLCDVKQGPSDDKQGAEQQHIKDDNHEFGAEQHGHQETRNEQSIIIDGDSSNRESNLINVKQKMTSTSHATSHDVDAAGDGETAVDVDSIKEEVEVIESPILDPAIDVHEGTVGSASAGVMEKICESVEAKQGPLGGLEHPCIIVDGGEVIVITDSEDEVETDNILPMETSKSDPPGGDKMFDQDDDMLLEKTSKSDITEGSKQMYNQDGDVLLKDTSNSDTFDGSEMFDQDGEVLLKETSNNDTLEGRKAVFDQDGEVLLKETSDSDMLEGSRQTCAQDGDVLLKETSDSDPTEGGKETYNQDDNVLLKETPNSDMPEGSKEIFEKDKAISREETSHSDTSAESKSMFEKDGDMKLECDEESFCTDEDKPETESEETCEGSWKDDLEDETTETSTDTSGDRLIDSDDFEAYTDEDTPEPVLEMDADTEEDPVHLSDTTEDILDTSDQRLSNSSQDDKLRPVPEHSTPPARLPSRGLTDEHRSGSELVQSGKLPDTGSGKEADTESTPTDATLSLSSSLSVHTLESDYDSDSDVYITECRLVVKEPAVKTEHEDEDDESDCGKDGRRSSKKPDSSLVLGDGIQKVDCSKMKSGKSGKMHMQKTDGADSLFDKQLLSNCAVVHLNDSSGFDIKDQEDPEIDADEGLKIPPQNKQESDSGSCLADDTVDTEDVPDEPEEDQPALGASATPGASTTPWSSTTPFLSATPGSSATPGGPPGSSATTESSTTPFPSATPGSSATPASSATPGSSVTPASSATPGSSVTPASSTTPVSIPVHLEMDFSEDVDNTSSPGVDVHNIIAGLIEQDISDTDSGRRDRSASLDDIFDDTWNYNSNFEPETDKTDTADITLALVDSDDGTASASNSDKNNQVFLINPTEELIDMRCTSVGRITPEARKEAERATSVTPETKEKRQEMSGAGKSSSHGSFDEDGERSSSTTGIAASTEDDDNVEDFPMLSTPKRRRLNRQDSQESHSERSCVGEVIYSSDEDTENSVAISDQDQQFGHIGNTKSDGVEDEVCASENSRETDSISEAQPGVSRVNAETLSDQRMFMSMDDLSSTQLSQLDRRLSAAPEENLKNVRRRSLLDKIRAKRKNRQQCEKTTQDKGEIKDNNLLSPQNDVHSEVLDSLNKVEDYLLRGKRILSILTDAFNTSHLHSNPTVQTWRDDLQLLHKSVQLPPTVIAVVGDTGAGKSSLLNALLNQPCVLPTSGVRACTAVVVEIVENTRNQNYEADIHFLSKEEWHEELEVLLKDLTKRDGSLQKGQPDPTSEAGVAYAKVRAVYGKVSKMKVLLKQTHITQWLNRVKKISVQSARHLRDDVNSYIENTDNGSRGEQFWPIVKRVKLYLPSCEVCSSGAVLVDLPGVRDANAARDKIAKEYLKNCTSVWVVASIHRAIDDHTAKDLLGENFRRQLLMDGQYGSVAFICTKTDSLIPSELKKLTPNFETLNDQLKAVKEELSVLESRKIRLNKKRMGQESEIAAMKWDYQEWKKELDQEPLSLEEEEESDAKKQSVAEVQQELENMDADIQQKEADVTDFIVQERKVTQQISVKEELRDIHQRKLVSMCAKARNEYSKNQIRKDFRAGIRELKQKSASVFMGEEEEDILDYDDGDGDGVADEDMGNVVDNLKVFCVSSTDYMKMTSLLTDVDGAPQVFSTPEETEIPALREFVHATSLQRRDRGVRQVVEKLGHFVLDLDNYLKMSGHNGKGGGKIQPVVTKHVTALLQRVDPIVSQLHEDILGLFESLLNPYIEAGSQLASQQAPATNDRWGSKVNKENRHLGGLAFMTYRATVSRQGRYSSPTAGMVDFNIELAKPLLVAVTFCWNKVFGSLFWSTLEKVKTSMSAALAAFTDDIKKNLTLIGFDRLQIEGVIHQILRNATAKLNEMVELMKDYVTSQQREISRIITPNIQAAMLNAYENASREHGAGCYNRMKQMMAGHIDSSRHVMFHNTVQEIKNRLSKLQVSVVEKVKGVLVALCRGFKVAFEPLWQSRDSCLDLRQNFSAGVSQCLIELHQLFQDCGLQFPALTPDSVAEPNVAEVAAAEETVDDVLGALRHDVEDSLKRLEEEPQGPGVKQEPLPSIVSESRDVLNFNYGQEDTKITEMPPYHSLIKSASSTPNTARPASEERQGNAELRQASASNTPTGASACKLLNENLRVSSLHSIIQTSAYGNKFKGGQVCEPSRPLPDSSQVTALVNASGVRENLPSHVLGKHPLQSIGLLDNNRKVMLVLPQVTMTTDAVSRPVMAPVNVPTMNSDAVPKHYYKLCLNANNLKRPASISRAVAAPGAVPIKQEPCDRAQKKHRIQVDEVLDLTGDSDTDAGMDNHSTTSSDTDLPSFL